MYAIPSRRAMFTPAPTVAAPAAARAYSQWQMATDTRIRRAAATALAGTDSKQGTIILPEFQAAPGDGSTQRWIWGSDANDEPRVQLFLNAGGYLLCWLLDPTQSRFARIDSNIPIDDGVKRQIMISYDVGIGSNAAGAFRQMYVGASNIVNTGEQWDGGTTTNVDYNAAVAGYSFGRGQTSPLYLGATLGVAANVKTGGIIANFSGALDFSVSGNRDKTLADNIGLNGEGLGLPTANAHVMIVGSAAQINAGGGSFGSIGPFAKEGGDVTPVGTQTTWA